MNELVKSLIKSEATKNLFRYETVDLQRAGLTAAQSFLVKVRTDALLVMGDLDDSRLQASELRSALTYALSDLEVERKRFAADRAAWESERVAWVDRERRLTEERDRCEREMHQANDLVALSRGKRTRTQLTLAARLFLEKLSAWVGFIITKWPISGDASVCLRPSA
jgi:hypothetical protein